MHSLKPRTPSPTTEYPPTPKNSPENTPTNSTYSVNLIDEDEQTPTGVVHHGCSSDVENGDSNRQVMTGSGMYFPDDPAMNNNNIVAHKISNEENENDKIEEEVKGKGQRYWPELSNSIKKLSLRGGYVKKKLDEETVSGSDCGSDSDSDSGSDSDSDSDSDSNFEPGLDLDGKSDDESDDEEHGAPTLSLYDCLGNEIDEHPIADANGNENGDDSDDDDSFTSSSSEDDNEDHNDSGYSSPQDSERELIVHYEWVFIHNDEICRRPICRAVRHIRGLVIDVEEDDDIHVHRNHTCHNELARMYGICYCIDCLVEDDFAMPWNNQAPNEGDAEGVSTGTQTQTQTEGTASETVKNAKQTEDNTEGRSSPVTPILRLRGGAKSRSRSRVSKPKRKRHVRRKSIKVIALKSDYVPNSCLCNGCRCRIEREKKQNDNNGQSQPWGACCERYCEQCAAGPKYERMVDWHLEHHNAAVRRINKDMERETERENLEQTADEKINTRPNHMDKGYHQRIKDSPIEKITDGRMELSDQDELADMKPSMTSPVTPQINLRGGGIISDIKNKLKKSKKSEKSKKAATHPTAQDFQNDDIVGIRYNSSSALNLRGGYASSDEQDEEIDEDSSRDSFDEIYPWYISSPNTDIDLTVWKEGHHRPYVRNQLVKLMDRRAKRGEEMPVEKRSQRVTLSCPSCFARMKIVTREYTVLDVKSGSSTEFDCGQEEKEEEHEQQQQEKNEEKEKEEEDEDEGYHTPELTLRGGDGRNRYAKSARSRSTVKSYKRPSKESVPEDDSDEEQDGSNSDEEDESDDGEEEEEQDEEAEDEEEEEGEEEEDEEEDDKSEEDDEEDQGDEDNENKSSDSSSSDDDSLDDSFESDTCGSDYTPSDSGSCEDEEPIMPCERIARPRRAPALRLRGGDNLRDENIILSILTRTELEVKNRISDDDLEELFDSGEYFPYIHFPSSSFSSTNPLLNMNDATLRSIAQDVDLVKNARLLPWDEEPMFNVFEIHDDELWLHVQVQIFHPDIEKGHKSYALVGINPLPGWPIVQIVGYHDLQNEDGSIKPVEDFFRMLVDNKEALRRCIRQAKYDILDGAYDGIRHLYDGEQGDITKTINFLRFLQSCIEYCTAGNISDLPFSDSDSEDSSSDVSLKLRGGGSPDEAFIHYDEEDLSDFDTDAFDTDSNDDDDEVSALVNDICIQLRESGVSFSEFEKFWSTAEQTNTYYTYIRFSPHNNPIYPCVKPFTEEQISSIMQDYSLTCQHDWDCDAADVLTEVIDDADWNVQQIWQRVEVQVIETDFAGTIALIAMNFGELPVLEIVGYIPLPEVSNDEGIDEDDDKQEEGNDSQDSNESMDIDSNESEDSGYPAEVLFETLTRCDVDAAITSYIDYSRRQIMKGCYNGVRRLTENGAVGEEMGFIQFLEQCIKQC